MIDRKESHVHNYTLQMKQKISLGRHMILEILKRALQKEKERQYGEKFRK